MAGSYILYNKLHYNGLMTDLGLIFIPRVTLVTAKNQHCRWKVRAYTRVRKTSEFPPLFLLPFSRDYPK